MATTIRPANRADIPRILAFIRALAAYERAPEAVTATEAGLERDGFGPNPFYFCLIAEHDGRPAGFAFYFFDYSTWVGRPGLYLEDLFVEPELRDLGIGKALLERVAAIAVEKGCLRLQWAVLDWNTPAIEFYRAMGGEFLDEWRNVRVSGEALRRLAGAAQTAEVPVRAVGAGMAGQGFSPGIRQAESSGALAPEVCFSENLPASGSSSAASTAQLSEDSPQSAIFGQAKASQ